MNRTRSKAIITTANPDFSFPKSAHILRRSEFRRVYEQGFRVTSPYFAAFCLAVEDGGGPRIGFTVPRALGNSVARNRMKRRMREAVRRELGRLGPRWLVVFNPRRAALSAPFPELQKEVQRVFSRCEP